MTNIDSITLEVADTAAAQRFYADAFGLTTQLRFRTAETASTGFRGVRAQLEPLFAYAAEPRTLGELGIAP